jgi:Membrane-bound lysozyme-inhibitor of c-type lysozyme
MIRALLFLLAMVGGVSSVQAQAYMNFQCVDGSKLSLIFEKTGTALVMVDGGALRLQKRKAASGLWYASPHGDFRAAGGKARFNMTGRSPTSCVKVGERR